MQRRYSALGLVWAGVIISLGICWSSVVATKQGGPAGSLGSAAAACTQAAGPCSKSEEPSAKLSFEAAVCDLGRLGLGTKNTCEFKFTNPGQALLKITNVKSTCGCAVAKLEKKEYAPGESGTIKVIYTAPRITSTAARHIYVSSNDTSNPKVRLTIKAKVVQMVQA